MLCDDRLTIRGGDPLNIYVVDVYHQNYLFLLFSIMTIVSAKLTWRLKMKRNNIEFTQATSQHHQHALWNRIMSTCSRQMARRKREANSRELMRMGRMHLLEDVGLDSMGHLLQPSAKKVGRIGGNSGGK